MASSKEYAYYLKGNKLALVQKDLNASALLNGIARNHRIEAINIYNEIITIR